MRGQWNVDLWSISLNQMRIEKDIGVLPCLKQQAYALPAPNVPYLSTSSTVLPHFRKLKFIQAPEKHVSAAVPSVERSGMAFRTS